MARPILIFFMVWAIVLIFPFHASRKGHAHHTSAVSYVFQKVGEQTVSCFSVEMIATPPRLMWVNEKNISKKEKHKKLDRFTHRFQVIVRNESDAKPLPGLDVRATFIGDEWKKTFRLRPFTENGSPTYAANVTLGPRGKYRVHISLDKLQAPGCKKNRPGQTLTAKLSFDNDFETLKEVMQSLMDTLDQLGRAALTAGLDGELVPPQKERNIRKLALRFRELIPWTANLREGESQEIYEDRAAKLLEISEQMEASAAKGDIGELVHRLAAARSICVNCHDIFQEADATGTLPRITGPRRLEKKSSPPR